MSDDHHTTKVMRGHYKWMVLVTIVWTILLNVAAKESIKYVPKARRFEKKTVEKLDTDLNENDSRRNGNKTDDDKNTMPNNATISLDDTTKPRINMKRDTAEDIEVTDAFNSRMQGNTRRHDNISPSITQDGVDGNTDNNKIAEPHHSVINETSIFHLLLHRAFRLVSLMKNMTVSRDKNETVNSLNDFDANYTKVQVALNANIEAIDSNKSAHQQFTATDRTPNLSETSEHSASLITNSNASRMNQASGLRLETRIGKYDSSLNGIKLPTKHSSGDTQRMGFSSRKNDATVRHRLIDGAARSSGSNGNSKHDRFSSPDTRGRIFNFSLTNIAFANHAKDKERKKKRLPSYIRSSNGEMSRILENKDARNVVKTIKAITVPERSRLKGIVDDEGTLSSLLRRSNEIEDSSVINPFNKAIKPFMKNDDTKKMFAKRRMHTDDMGNSGTLSLFASPEYSTQRMAYQVTTSSNGDRQNAKFDPISKKNNINLIPIANDIPRALFKEESAKKLQALGTAVHNDEISTSTMRTDENFQRTNHPTVDRPLKSPAGPRPEMEMVDEQQQKMQRINYIVRKRAERRSYLLPFSSKELDEINVEKIVVARRNEEADKGISWNSRSDDTKNNEVFEAPDMNVGTKRFSSDGKFVDNAENPDGKSGNRIHRSVVNISLTGFQTDQRSHKSVIAQDCTGGNVLRQDEKQDHVQERKEQEQKLFSEMDAPVIGGSRLSENGALGSIALENSNAFSSVTMMQRNTNVLKPVMAHKRSRKIEFSQSDTGDSQDSRKRKTGDDDVISSSGPTEISTTLLRDGAKVRSRVIAEKSLAKPIAKIDWDMSTDTPSSIEIPLPEQHSRDCDPDDTGEGEYDCNEDGVTTDIVRLKGSQAQHNKALTRDHDKDNSEKKLLDSQSNIPNKDIASAVESAHIGSVDKDGSVPKVIPTEKGRNMWKDNAIGVHITETNRIVAILMKNHPGIDYGMSITHSSGLDDESDGIDKLLRYRRKLKVDTTNSATTVASLKVRDSTIVKNDTSKNRRKTSNHTDSKTVDAEHCETCQTAGIGENTTDAPNEKVVSSSERSSQKNVVHHTEKIESSITDFQEIESTFRTSKINEIAVDPIFTVGASLVHAPVEFKVSDYLGPEARVGEQLQHEDSRILIRGKEATSRALKRENLIPSRERAVKAPFISDKLHIPDDAVSSGLIVDQRNEYNENSLYVHPDAGFQTGHFYSPVKKKAYTGHTQGPSITRVIESFTDGRNSSLEFSNNALTLPGSRENISIHATAQTGSPSSSGRRRKSLGHDEVTAGSTSSTKTDSSIWSIGRTSDDDRYSMRKGLLQVSPLGVSSVSPVYGELGDGVATEQIKRGFTSEDSITISVTQPTTRRYTGSTNSAPSLSPIVRDVHPTENIIPVIEGNVSQFESSSRDLPIIEAGRLSDNNETLSQEGPLIPVVDVSTVNFTAPGTENNDQEFETSFETQKTLNLTAQRSLSLQRPQTGRPHENSRVHLGTGNGQSLNHTDRDNSTRVTATLNQWPVKHSAVVEGDLLLGGLMMVHEREDSITCGPVMPQGGVQALEAMLYTLDWLNKQDLVPGVKIGAHILDDCDKDTYGLEMAVDFIKGSISNIDGAEYHCNKTAVRKVISGVVGAASSVTSIQVANLLRLFRIPQVSFFSTSPELSNKMRFEYFTRTIPSDHYQVKAMVDIVRVMGWSYVSIIYEESNYGEKAYEELEKLLGKHQICIAVKEKLSKDSGVAEAHVYDNIVLKLLTKPRARGCIIFASDQEVAGVMKAVRRCNATGAFSWIGSDGWSARSLVSDGNEPEMEGTLSVQPQANPVEGFEDYFLNLTVENNRRNPWFVEFWEDHFKCRYPNSSQTPYNNYTEECTTTEKLTKQNTAFEDQLQFVSDAVLAFAYAFREMHKNLCRGNPGLCDAMKPTKGTELLNYLRNVEFKGLSGDVFHFDKNGDGPARYNIIHFKQVSPGKYKWIRVGKYLEGELRLNMSEIQFRLGHPEPPESVCSLPCEMGQAKKYVEGESCCWHCFNCTQYQIRHWTDEKQCVLCPQGTVPDETHSDCREIPEEFLRPESGWAIGAMSFSFTGILITLLVGGVFLKHNDTPIVRASGRELSYILLTGILLCYLVTFALVLRPNDIVCSMQRFSAGFCFTVVYAALLTKTNRISRIFNAGKRSAKRPSFISPRSQLIICGMLVAVQILINIVWMVIDPAKAMHHYPTREDNLLVCNSYIDASYMIAFTYPIILIVVCTVYAVLTRKIPEAFNESKHIGFTMYTTCVIWLAFVPLYFATGSHVALRITSMSVTISLSASVTIACLFSPKLYIILIHPERNVRPNMMMRNQYNTTKGSVVTATNQSSMLAPVTLTAATCDQNKAVKKHVITTIDCSTQSEQYEMELKDQKNGKITPAVMTRETQTLLNNNGKESSVVTSPVIKEKITDENLISSRGPGIGKITNGPVNQNDVPL